MLRHCHAQSRALAHYQDSCRWPARLQARIGPLGDMTWAYEHLYLDTDSKPLRVSMKGGLLIDPRDDPKPATSVEVAGFE